MLAHKVNNCEKKQFHDKKTVKRIWNVKRYKTLLSATFIIVSVVAMSFSVLAFVGYRHGDANGDGFVSPEDVIVLKQLLTNCDASVAVTDGNPDVNGDGVVNLKDVTLLRRYLAGGWGVELPETEDPETVLSDDLAQYEVLSTSCSDAGVTSTSFKFGSSVLGRDMVCWSIQPDSYSRTVLLNFAIHGWEDSYVADGQLLVDLGNALVEYYSFSSDLKGCRLLIIPCANPDGIAEGTTNNGFGRCNADGIDLNRDFDANHVVNTTARNYTPAPFSSVESQALRDLVWAADPDVVVDL